MDGSWGIYDDDTYYTSSIYGCYICEYYISVNMLDGARNDTILTELTTARPKPFKDHEQSTMSAAQPNKRNEPSNGLAW